ncbi:hypothetical protein MAP00_000896 [Monascus purpureus]|nr:hypothetical protein MAP00_000896 [Monascus purpureus]
MEEVLELGRVPPATAGYLSRCYEKDKSEFKIVTYPKLEAWAYLIHTQILFRQAEMAFGIRWHSHSDVWATRDIDEMVYLFFKLVKASEEDPSTTTSSEDTQAPPAQGSAGAPWRQIFYQLQTYQN